MNEMMNFKLKKNGSGLLNFLNLSSSSGQSNQDLWPSFMVKIHSSVLSFYLLQCLPEWDSAAALEAPVSPSFCLAQLTGLLIFAENFSVGSLLNAPLTFYPALAVTLSLSTSHSSFLRESYIQPLHFLISHPLLDSLFFFSF